MKLIKITFIAPAMLALIAGPLSAQQQQMDQPQCMGMESMQEEMAAIRAEQNPERRREMMADHMGQMQEMMGMMRQHMSEGGMSGEGMAGMHGSGGDISRCMEMMGEQMEMMNHMMQGMDSERMQGKGEADAPQNHQH